jgi:glycosyltransferase involved in cell wall biosynthesis
LLKYIKIKLKGLLLNTFFWLFSKFKSHSYSGTYGVNFIGYARADMGLAEAHRMMIGAYKLLDSPFLVRDFNPGIRSLQANTTLNEYMASNCEYKINCICIGPDLIYKLPIWLRHSEWLKKYNIGYWFWELPALPDEWGYAEKIVDEIWVNTEFIAHSMGTTSKRVTKIPFGVEFDIDQLVMSRQDFDLPLDKFIFLCSFDFNSSLFRKNPQAVIDAYLLAISSGLENSILVIKSINGNSENHAYAKLKQQVSKSPNIVFLEGYLDNHSIRSLMAAADCYISLHRSEGLGLGMAESMYLGKPVIATAYSGNIEFMNSENSCLVPFHMIDVGPEEYFGWKNQSWAEPDIGAASQYMMALAKDPALKNQIGVKAAKYMREHHSYKIASAAISRRLTEIHKDMDL